MYARALCRLNPNSNAVQGVKDLLTGNVINEGEKTFQLRLNLAALDYQLWRSWSYVPYSKTAPVYSATTVEALLRPPVVAPGMAITGTANSAIVPYMISVNQASAPMNIRTYFRVATGSTLPAGLTLSPAGLLSGTPAGSGVSTFAVVAQNPAGDSTPQTFTLNIAPSAKSQARQWMSAHGYGSASMASKATDDSDGDGIELTMEYGFGGNPLAPDGALVKTTAAGASSLRLEWLALELGATYIIEGSGDLQTWTDATSTATFQNLGASGIYQRRQALLPLSGDRRFYRVRATFEPGSLD
jgi:hypothetical protein